MYPKSRISFGLRGYPTAQTQPIHLQQPTSFLPQSMPQGLPGSQQNMYAGTSNSGGGQFGIYQCPYCPQKFDRAGRFEAHMNGHREYKPFQCRELVVQMTGITMSFTTQEALSSHKRKDRVTCENCGHLVAKKNLARHNRSHCSSLY
ncbi:hypothetical protein M408DRAFT_299172 [Serendipita vermifera MAFF 305830]|uniref:C2H2-type domain-containing protein n=1 Tax=Serendipita vermifera MAFF 305830 TaxID=933852 RepID=A0A0C3AB85_SERVB|nr:hypothetical protein M408DRAFT_299172 [Serendipita vermifera MAFF 305830]